MIDIGWFSTGRGEGSLGMLQTVQEAILRGELEARIQFIFSNREPGEAEGSDRFFQQARDYDIPLVTLSSQGFRRSRGGGPFSRHRLEFDREAMQLLEGYTPDICVLAGYMLITDVELCNRYTMLNFHPAPPNGPVGTWQDVIWSLIESGAQEAGGYIHLATEDLDRGPVLTYYTFPIRGDAYDSLWRETEGRSAQGLRESDGEELPLFQLIRQEGVRRERPLLVETLKAFAAGDIRVEGRRVLDTAVNPIDGLNLNQAVEKAVQGRG